MLALLLAALSRATPKQAKEPRVYNIYLMATMHLQPDK